MGTAGVRSDLRRRPRPGRRAALRRAGPARRLPVPPRAPRAGEPGPQRLVRRPLLHLPPGPRRRRPRSGTEALARGGDPSPGRSGRRRRRQPPLRQGRHGHGAHRGGGEQPGRPGLPLPRRRGHLPGRRRGHGDRHRSCERLRRRRHRLQPVVPGGRPDELAPWPGRGPGGGPGPGAATGGLPAARPVGDARQRAGHRPVREAGLHPGAGVLREAQEPHQRAAVLRSAQRRSRSPQPLRPHRRRRGPPPGHRRACRRRRRRVPASQPRRSGDRHP